MREVVSRMCEVLAHRGPDDQGVLVSGPAAIGMRRLSIIDLSGGHQPMSGCDPTICIVFNGEIYNFRELKHRLEARGHTFRTNSDTEAIVHAFEEYHHDCVNYLRGMFAFAIWNERDRELFVARDRTGKKPLYYTQTSRGSFIFGSELKALREHSDFTAEINPHALDAYLTFGYVPDPLTIFRGVHKLPPGHIATLKQGQITVRRYWDFPYDEPQTNPIADEEEAIAELQALLDESVRVRMIADVPLGAFLSGGVDSSTVVGLMARNSSHPVKTFSIGFREDSYNELKYARLAAQKFATEHHEFIVTPEICDVVDDLVWHFDEPFADSSAIPTYIVSRLAREHVKVVLSGDGGDELFAGYTRYALDRKRGGFAKLPRVLREGVMQRLGRSLPHGAWGRNYLHNVTLEPLDRYVEDISIFTRLNKPFLYTENFRSQLGAAEPARSFVEIAAQSRTDGGLVPLLYLDSKTYLPGDILTKVDRMSMAASLEARVPLLDHTLVEFVCRRISARMKLKGLTTKYIFKQAVKDLVPSEILNRPKQGFGVPIDQWINQQLRARVRETLTEPRTIQRGYIEPRYVNVLLNEHERGRRDHATELWALFMLELWNRLFIDRPPAKSVRDPIPCLASGSPAAQPHRPSRAETRL
ncbi:MAG TPA: asparagine synthase (glutamine-hydrolyzing), partial [Candidatus Binatia bacterium]|nr:asparagine synthase (glutamine-hydrolyzing) [Candidatus Binatia bacterium]